MPFNKCVDPFEADKPLDSSLPQIEPDLDTELDFASMMDALWIDVGGEG